MSRVKPVDPDALAALDDIFASVEGRMGFVPMSQKVTGHKRDRLDAWQTRGC